MKSTRKKTRLGNAVNFTYDNQLVEVMSSKNLMCMTTEYTVLKLKFK